MAIKMIIFDLDGVLTETSEQHFIAWQQLAKELGISIDRKFNEQLKGVSRMDSLKAVLTYGGMENRYSEEELEVLAAKKNAYYKALIHNFTEVNLFEGVIELFEKLRDSGIRIAIASASMNAPFLIRAIGIEKYVDYIVDPREVLRGKPAPDIFRKPMEAFDMVPDECIGVEDAQAGIQAIKAAGMYAVGIGDPKVLTGADVVYDHVKDIDLDVIIKQNPVR